MKIFLNFLFIILIIPIAYSQKADTLIIDASNVNTKVLIEGTHRYLVYFKNGKDSSRKTYQLWTRKIDFILYMGEEAISVTQEWEDNDTIFHKTYSVNDKKTFAPLYQESWWKGRELTTVDFLNKKVLIQGIVISNNDTSSRRKKILEAFNKSFSQFVFNWHLDLEVFPILPYRNNRTFLINFYDPGLAFDPQTLPYTVIGSAKLAGYNNDEIDCWLLQQKGKISTEVFWISKKTKEVLKMEQEFSGRYRYKIKLGFSV